MDRGVDVKGPGAHRPTEKYHGGTFLAPALWHLRPSGCILPAWGASMGSGSALPLRGRLDVCGRRRPRTRERTSRVPQKDSPP